MCIRDSSRWTPVSQRPLTAARPSFGRRASGGRPSSRTSSRDEDGREYRAARPPSHGSRPTPGDSPPGDSPPGDGDGVALFDEGARRDSPEDWTNGRATPSSPPRQYHQQQHQQQQHQQQQQQQPLRYPRAPPSASSNLPDRPGVLSSDYSARYAAFVAGLRDVETRADAERANEAEDLSRRDVENLSLIHI